MTQKEAFLYYLKLGDFEMLNLVLVDTKKFFGVGKEVFLDKLRFLFDENLLAGSSDVNIKKVVGKIDSYSIEFCALKHSNGFRLMEVDGKVVEICGEQEDQDIIDFENVNQYDFVFGDDQLVDFIPSAEYISTSNRCKKAYDQLITDGLMMLTGIGTVNWLGTHSTLYEKVKDLSNIFSYNEFKTLYSTLSFCIDSIQYYDHCQEALESQASMGLMEWLKKFNRLYFTKTLGFHDLFKASVFSDEIYKFNAWSNLYASGKDYHLTIEFSSLYDRRLQKSNQ